MFFFLLCRASQANSLQWEKAPRISETWKGTGYLELSGYEAFWCANNMKANPFITCFFRARYTMQFFRHYVATCFPLGFLRWIATTDCRTNGGRREIPMYAMEERARAGAERAAGYLAASVRRVRGSETFALNGGWRLRAPVHACLGKTKRPCSHARPMPGIDDILANNAEILVLNAKTTACCQRCNVCTTIS